MKLGEARWLWALLLVAAAAVPAARGLWLDMPASGTKCISEELHNNAVVLADYYAFTGDDYDVNATLVPTITVKVNSIGLPFKLLFRSISTFILGINCSVGLLEGGMEIGGNRKRC